MLFWKILIAEFIAEMGDKTQLMLIAMTSRYKLRDILLGTAAAVLVLRKVRRLIRAAGAAAFCAVVFMESSIRFEKNASLA